MSSKKLINSQFTQPNEVTTFQALRQLKQAQNHHNSIKNRINVLRIHDEKNIGKIQTQQNKMNKILQVREQNLRDKQKNEEVKKEIKMSVEKQKSLNRESKEMQLSRIKQIKNEIVQSKASNYKQLCESRHQNEEKIGKNKFQVLEKKQKVRNKVVQMEENTKQSILEFITKKNNTIHESILAERDIYMKKKVKKDKQISRTSLLQMQMIQKYSESQVAYKETKNKLDSMLGNIRKQNRQNKSKLKSLVKDKSPQTSFYGQMI